MSRNQNTELHVRARLVLYCLEARDLIRKLRPMFQVNYEECRDIMLDFYASSRPEQHKGCQWLTDRVNIIRLQIFHLTSNSMSGQHLEILLDKIDNMCSVVEINHRIIGQTSK